MKFGSGRLRYASARHFSSSLCSDENGVADGIRTRNNKLHKLGLYH